jgi:hypothetical protein
MILSGNVGAYHGEERRSKLWTILMLKNAVIIKPNK